MKLGLLWYDADQRVSPQQRLAEAATRFAERFGRPANCCHVNPADLFADPAIAVVADPSILKHHFWVGRDEALAIGRDPVATSILVHELTHFLQMKSIAHPEPVTCRIWNDREQEAFDVQAQWLRDASASVQVFSIAMLRLNLRAVHTLCFDHSGVASQKSWTKG